MVARPLHSRTYAQGQGTHAPSHKGLLGREHVKIE